jgi:hypothetical protein
MLPKHTKKDLKNKLYIITDYCIFVLMKAKETAISELELRLFRTKMAQRGLKTSALADALGFKAANVTNVLSGNVRSWPVLKAINRFFQERIFTKPSRIRRLKRDNSPQKSHVQTT